MSRKRISNRDLKGIAQERMDILLDMAEHEAMRGSLERSRRYLGMALRISERTSTSMPDRFLYCRQCLTPLVPGRNCRVRLRSKRVVTRCLSCEGLQRHPYRKERRASNAGSTKQEGA